MHIYIYVEGEGEVERNNLLIIYNSSRSVNKLCTARSALTIPQISQGTFLHWHEWPFGTVVNLEESLHGIYRYNAYTLLLVFFNRKCSKA